MKKKPNLLERLKPVGPLQCGVRSAECGVTGRPPWSKMVALRLTEAEADLIRRVMITKLVEHKPSTTKQIFDDLQPVLGRILKAWLVGKS